MILRALQLAFIPLIAFVCCGSAQAQTLYRLVDLGQLDGVGAYPTGINDAGQVSGWLIDSNHDQRAVRSVADTFQLVPGLENVIATAGNINTHGDVGGNWTLIPWPTNLIHAMRYTDSTGIEDLGTLGGNQADVTGINASGQVVGWSYTSGGGVSAFLAVPGEPMRSLGFSYAGGINDLGQVAGYLGTPSGPKRAYLYTPGIGAQDLGAPHGSTEAQGINNAGQLACSMLTADSHEHACRYTPGVGFQDLDPVTTRNSKGWDINDNGDVVGSFSTPLYAHAFIYTDTEGFVDLNTRIPSGGEDWILVAANAINNEGEIVGTAQYQRQGPPRGFKLVPADVTPPVISDANAVPSSIWPPNGHMVPVLISVSSDDNSGATPRCNVTGVVVSEPNSSSDVTITGDLSISVRAKRDTQSATGRTYTASILCSDPSGNTSGTSVAVNVPHANP